VFLEHSLHKLIFLCLLGLLELIDDGSQSSTWIIHYGR
jgi:hypothetical protein